MRKYNSLKGLLLKQTKAFVKKGYKEVIIMDMEDPLLGDQFLGTPSAQR
jgi:hypothetical protein